MDEFEDLLRKTAAGRTNVMIVGAPKTQREDIARRVHLLSSRRAIPLLEVDCSQPAEEFQKRLPEILEMANHGTLLLAGLDALSFDSQRDLMRAVETRQVVRPDGTREIEVRYYATATPEIHAEARASRFRLDLFYKLSGFTITVPDSPR